MERDAAAGLEAAIFRARGALARQDHAAARSTLDAVLPRYPDALGPRYS